MRPGPNGRRPRGRPNRKQQGGPSRSGGFDGGSDGRSRGNAHQVYERYVGMARDAISGGDRVAAETYYQHAEHYFRVMNSSTDPEPPERRQPRHEGNGPPQANPAPGNGGASAAPAHGAEDREGLDRALRADGPAVAPRQPQPAPGENQPRDGQAPERTQGRRRMRQRPPRDADSGGGDEPRERRPWHDNGQGQAKAAETGPAGEAPGAEDPQRKKTENGDDSAAADIAAPGDKPAGT